MYNGRHSESYINTRVHLYKAQVNKISISLPPDSDSCVQAIKRANYQAYIWSRCTEITSIPIILKKTVVITKTNKLKPVWYLGSQIPPSLKKSNEQKRGGSRGSYSKKKNPEISSKSVETATCDSDANIPAMITTNNTTKIPLKMTESICLSLTMTKR